MNKILMLGAFAVATSGLMSATQVCGTGEYIFGTSIAGLTLTSGTPVTSDFSCEIGSTIFSNFEIVPGGTIAPSYYLELSSNTVGDNLDFNTDEGLGEDIKLYYTITSGVTGMTLTVAGNASNITEIICDEAIYPGTTCGDTPLATLSATSGNSDTVTFAGVAEDYVFKDIQAGNGLSDFDQTIIPEPMTLSLMGVGLLGLGIFGRRRIGKK